MDQPDDKNGPARPDLHAALLQLRALLQNPDEQVRRAVARGLINEMEPGLAEVLKMINYNRSQTDAFLDQSVELLVQNPQLADTLLLPFSGQPFPAEEPAPTLPEPAVPVARAPGKTVYNFELYADYSQFYLGDPDDPATLNFNWTKATSADALAATGGFLMVGTARYDFVPVEVEIFDARPPDDDIDGWDQVAECSLNLPSGRLRIDGCLAYGPESPVIELTPGHYRVVIFYGGLEQAAFDNEDGDFYRVRLWPDAFRVPPRVIRRYVHSSIAGNPDFYTDSAGVIRLRGGPNPDEPVRGW